MRRILIAGCGYVGAAAADLFYDAGWTVEGWTRSAESAATLSGKPYPVYAVDISGDEVAARSPGEFDAVVHCACMGRGMEIGSPSKTRRSLSTKKEEFCARRRSLCWRAEE